jgi:O-acetylhomoserine (thiol)-lyase
MSDRQFGFDTRAIHAGQRPDPETGARAMPIYATTSYVFEDAQHAADLFALQNFGNIYTRIGNPTTAAFEERMASLEGGLGAVATASGQAAQLIAILTLAQQGDEVVASQSLYGGTFTQFDVTLRRMGIAVAFVDFGDLDQVEKAITEDTKLLYGETIGNPRADVLDIAACAGLAKANGIPLMVDNTFATPYLCRPIEHGADIVVHSATKFIGGHGVAIGGVIVESGRFPFDNGRFPLLTEPSPAYHDLMFWENFREYGYLMRARAELLRDIGAAPSPFNSFLLLLGLETLPLRMERHAENALAVARFLRERPEVSWVHFPVFEDNPWTALAERYLPGGPGAVFTFGLNGGFEAGVRFIESVELASHLANVGDAKTLVIHPASTTHQQVPSAEREAAGIGDDMIRISVGLETIEDILADLTQALEAAP